VCAPNHATSADAKNDAAPLVAGPLAASAPNAASVTPVPIVETSYRGTVDKRLKISHV